MNRNPSVLVVEDDDSMRELLEEELREAGYRPFTAGEGAEALARFEREDVDVVVTDLVMPGMKGNELLSRLQRANPEVPVVVITAFGSVESAVELMKAGAFHYVSKPFRMEALLEAVRSAADERAHMRELADQRRIRAGEDTGFVAESPAMRRVLDLVLRAAPSDTPILLRGESGTGKELLARAVHTHGPRGKRPFLAVNCAAIPETLLESQLFGHRRGAFTDAREDRRGLFQEASGGTIFLDEIGDMPTSLQTKLLRVLQEKEVLPVGASAPVAVDARVVAATHQDLERLVAEGRFRQDLYYRLNVIAIAIPPLRERPQDLIPLLAHLLEKHGRRQGRPHHVVSPAALELIRRHGWPGNVRELENLIERALVLGKDDVLGVDDLPDALRERVREAPASREMRPLAEIEREHILRTLRAVGGNKAAAAKALGLDRKTLYRKLSQYRGRRGEGPREEEPEA